MASETTHPKMLTSFVKSPEVQVATLSLFVLIVTYKLVIKLSSKNNPPPPGPFGFPVLGHLPLLGKKPYLTFMKMREKFGDIFKIQMGSWAAVVLNGKHAIKEALKNHGDVFAGRPELVSSMIVGNGESLGLGNYSEKWKIHRKLANTVLSEYSHAKKSPIQEMIQEEVDDLVAWFESQKGASFDPKDEIFMCTASILYQLCYGRKQEVRKDKDFEIFLENTGEFSRFVSARNAVDILPWLRYIMPWKLKAFSNLIEKGKAFRRSRVTEHKETFSPTYLRDITDGLIAVSKEETGFTEEKIYTTIDTLLLAGLDSVTMALQWTVLLMAAHPDVQKRVQAEIDDIVGDTRRPGIEDRGQLVYTEAVLHEINRFVSLAPLSIPHLTIRDTQFCGYSIKKDTVVLFNLYSMAHDKDVWGDPEVFRPERFLDESGHLKKALVEEFLPFSTGHRKCLGEFLARTKMFLFFSGLLQRCTIIKPPEVTEYNMDCVCGLARQSLPYTIQAQLRT